MIAKGLVGDADTKVWEVEVDGGEWSPYDQDSNQALERARLHGRSSCQVKIRNWVYEIDFVELVQRNLKTLKERPVRCKERGPSAGQITHMELKDAVAYFVSMQTISRAPAAEEEARDEVKAAAGEDIAVARKGRHGELLRR